MTIKEIDRANSVSNFEVPDRSIRVLEPSEIFDPKEALTYIEGCDYPETSDYAIVAERLNQMFRIGGKDVLEVCSGPGALSNELWLLGADKVVGLDGDPIMVEHALEKYGLNPKKKLQFKLGLVYHIPFPDNSFDAAVCQNSWHQLFKPQEAIKEMVRVLRPGGFGFIRDFQRDCNEGALRERLKHTKPEIVPLLLDSILASFTQQEFRRMIRGAMPAICIGLVIDAPSPRGLSERVDQLIEIDPVPHWMDYLISQDVLFRKES